MSREAIDRASEGAKENHRAREERAIKRACECEQRSGRAGGCEVAIVSRGGNERARKKEIAIEQEINTASKRARG